MRTLVAEILHGLSDRHYNSMDGGEECRRGEACQGKLALAGEETLRWTQQWLDGKDRDEEVARLELALADARQEADSLREEVSQLGEMLTDSRKQLETRDAQWNRVRELLREVWDRARRDWEAARQLGLVK